MTARSKRLFPRHSCNIPIQYRISGVDDYSEAVLYNSSRNGMYFEPQTMIRPGERIHIAMSTYVPSEEEPDKHCYYLATAVWCRSIPKDADPRFGCGASLIKGSCWLDGRDAKDICYLCDMCNAAIPCQDLQKTDEFLYLCPSCRQHLEKMPDGHLKRSIKRFLIGNVL